MKVPIIFYVISFILGCTGAVINDLTDMNSLTCVLISFSVVTLITAIMIIIHNDNF